MKTPAIILFICLATFLSPAQGRGQNLTYIDFFGVKKNLPLAPEIKEFKTSLSDTSIQAYVQNINTEQLEPFLKILLAYKADDKPDDWLYYQAIRKMAQYLSPKADNYYRYTFFKWWLLVHSGYDAILAYSNNYLLFYVQSEEAVYNIPFRMRDGKQYVCLNYHDYGSIDFEKNKFVEVALRVKDNTKAFSYKVTRLPDFNHSEHAERELQFAYGAEQYQFRVKLNPQVKSLFTNYPVVDYELQCNMPLSESTYQSLIPSLKKATARMKTHEGVEFLLQFTRYAFLFKPDHEVFGSEKRMSPEQTLLYDYSDCEDRSALFFYLVKEIYNLPMLVLTYPNHVTVAVQFEKPYGKTIDYKGAKYSVCEPSPQRIDLRIGQLPPELSKKAYEIAYAYQPFQNK